jgi:CHAT domain-containing protein/Tfp pilus assembly protein PilF
LVVSLIFGWLAAMGFATCAVAGSLSTGSQTASINTYRPQLQQLQNKADWVGMEKLARQALDDLKLHGSGADVQAAALFLGTALRQQHHDQEAEPLYRSLLASDEKVLGPYDPITGTALTGLGLVLTDEARYAEAEPLLKRSLVIFETAFGRFSADVAMALNNLAQLYRLTGQYAQAEPLYARSQGILEKALGASDPRVARSLDNLAQVYQAQGRYAQAEPLFQRSLAIFEKVDGPDHPDVAGELNNLAEMHYAQGQYAQAEPLYRRALAIFEKAFGPDSPELATVLSNLGALYYAERQYAQAEPLLQRSLAIRDKALGPDHPDVATSLSVLAKVYDAQSKYAQAEPLYQRSLAIREKALGPDHTDVAMGLNDLAFLYLQQGEFAKADPLFQRSVAIYTKALGPEHLDVVRAVGNLAYDEELQSRFDAATQHYRQACTPLGSISRKRNQPGDAAQFAQHFSNVCSARLSLALWGWSSQGGGAAATDRPEALRLEAFTDSQRAVQSAAGDAMARSAALAAAQVSAVGPQALAYEAALQQRDTLDQQFARAAGEGGAAGVEHSQALAKSRDQLAATINRLAAELKTQAPRYWDYRSPEAVSVAALQATSGADASLLHDDEALLTFLVVPGKDKGLVFAVSKQQVAWAQLALSGDELKSLVIRLRAQIDPEGYGLSGAGVQSGTFERQVAYQLYQALLGNASIQAVIRDKSVLLFVPSGALTSLPPGLLVTAPPVGGAAGDSDASALRATAWLLRSKAVALLPAVSSLRTLRQILPANRASTPDPLLVFADPDFRRLPMAPKAVPASASTRSYSSYFRDGIPLADALDDVPSLPGTRIEGEALERALQGKPGSLLTGRDASKAQLFARNSDGRLAQVRVLEFATHGLVAGDASDLAEPALLLAAGATPADELLLASEAATLKLNADWVLLSACNTASPDAPEAQGLSGLSRAFFYAGARSLLVSHWRVRDDVAPLLIPAMLLAQRDQPDTSRAQALRQATLAILDDRSLNAASPAAWAPFTLIGEAGR